jgi:hypothetical protein
MTVGEAGVAVESSLTRTQSRGVALTPGGSHVTVDTTARRLSFQIASVGRPSTALTIVAGGPGCFGAGGSVKPVITAVRSEIAIDGCAVPAAEPVMRA